MAPIYSYLFVEPTFMPPAGTIWSRFEISAPSASLSHAGCDLEEGPAGPTCYISQRVYDDWRHQLLVILARVMMSMPERFYACMGEIWTPARTLLVRLRVGELNFPDAASAPSDVRAELPIARVIP